MSSQTEAKQLSQSCINAIGYPADIPEFRAMVEHRFMLSKSIFFSLNTDLFFGDFDSESKFHPKQVCGRITSWSAPRWFTGGDISFFYHSRRALPNARKIYNKLAALVETKELDASIESGEYISIEDRCLIVLRAIAFRGYEFAKEFSGKIFSIGQASSDVVQESSVARQHWSNIHYCSYENINFLNSPVDYAEFKETIRLEQRAITPLTKPNFNFLREQINEANPELNLLNSVEHRDQPIAKISEQGGWRAVVRQNSLQLIFEVQVREYILDSLLKEVSHCLEAKVLKEVASVGQGESGWIDYVLALENKYYAVEAKCLKIDSTELTSQLAKYCRSTISLKGKTAVTENMCVLMDQRAAWVFVPDHENRQPSLTLVGTLKELSNLTSKEITTRIFGMTNV